MPFYYFTEDVSFLKYKGMEEDSKRAEKKDKEDKKAKNKTSLKNGFTNILETIREKSIGWFNQKE